MTKGDENHEEAKLTSEHLQTRQLDTATWLGWPERARERCEGLGKNNHGKLDAKKECMNKIAKHSLLTSHGLISRGTL